MVSFSSRMRRGAEISCLIAQMGNGGAGKFLAWSTLERGEDGGAGMGTPVSLLHIEPPQSGKPGYMPDPPPRQPVCRQSLGQSISFLSKYTRVDHGTECKKSPGF